MTSLPLDFPPLLEMAERAANDVHSAAMLSVFAKYDSVSSSLSPSVVMVDAHARLLSDLTRPESQAVWLRWLAGRVGVPVSIGAPAWARHNTGWSCVVGYELGLDDGYGQALFWFGASPNHPERGDRLCPALPNPDSTDAPIRALVLAILTVGAA